MWGGRNTVVERWPGRIRELSSVLSHVCRWYWQFVAKNRVGVCVFVVVNGVVGLGCFILFFGGRIFTAEEKQDVVWGSSGIVWGSFVVLRVLFSVNKVEAGSRRVFPVCVRVCICALIQSHHDWIHSTWMCEREKSFGWKSFVFFCCE